MARYYVEKDGEWNIFSTIIDDFLFDEFICLDALKARLLYERFKELTEDMDSLLTDNPRVNVMTYSEAIKRKRADTPQTDMDEDIVRSYGFKVESYRQAKAKDEPQTDCGWKYLRHYQRTDTLTYFLLLFNYRLIFICVLGTEPVLWFAS